MRNTIDNRMLGSIPLVERTIESSGNELFITYTIIDDLDFDITLKKTYHSYEQLENSVVVFLSDEKKHNEDILSWSDDFSIKQKKAKKELFLRFDSGRLFLPDNGEGFIFDGDVNYMRTWIGKL
ncbi:hypothetical protein RCM87_18810 [Escherichia marmotae]|uniref:Uncharacterized protein n=1 Tax=Escherichia marmotae TaxID=1499973 RepID=A0A7L6L5C9_9ESCH|nr:MULTISPECIES: hypothetical protein [Escherichia]EFN9758087.1 hypothetical protein [Escherichia coli]EFO1629977.1 hypothetical protein [Escherichia coli]MBA7740539.1 hypothetical protein [Escherichia marmotae]MBA7954672.1 hypothetical protein [Escherichia marmotae]MBB2417415.1 hypothetical protein [Escherichia sp. 11.1596]